MKGFNNGEKWLVGLCFGISFLFLLSIVRQLL